MLAGAGVGMALHARSDLAWHSVTVFSLVIAVLQRRCSPIQVSSVCCWGSEAGAAVLAMLRTLSDRPGLMSACMGIAWSTTCYCLVLACIGQGRDIVLLICLRLKLRYEPVRTAAGVYLKSGMSWVSEGGAESELGCAAAARRTGLLPPRSRAGTASLDWALLELSLRCARAPLADQTATFKRCLPPSVCRAGCRQPASAAVKRCSLRPTRSHAVRAGPQQTVSI